MGFEAFRQAFFLNLEASEILKASQIIMPRSGFMVVMV